MQTNTSLNTPYRDKYKEACFKDSYGLSTKIEVTNFLDKDGNWEIAIIKFDYKGDIYGLIEHFKAGDDNSTNYVIYELNGKEVERFDRYYDAELKVVYEMRKK